MREFSTRRFKQGKKRESTVLVPLTPFVLRLLRKIRCGRLEIKGKAVASLACFGRFAPVFRGAPLEILLKIFT
nr:MAG TPA: hypothetical protein [Caudoviricetes sp.]